MKKIAIVFMSMILATGAALAQKTFTFGPKIGVDYTHYWGKNTMHGGQLNYQAGLFMEYRFNNKFSIAPEVVFAAQGGKNDGAVLNSPTDYFDAVYTDNMNYINVPVMLKYYVCPSLSIDFGPQLGINVYHKCIIKGKDGHKDYKETYDYGKNAKSVDFGLGLGLTYNISKDVFVQGRYTMGLTDAFKKVEGYPVSFESKNGNAQIAIGYRF
jgi:hypothetical protein